MSIADDLVEQCEPWITPDLETYLRAVGGMFAEVEELSEDSFEAALVKSIPEIRNELPDPGFDHPSGIAQVNVNYPTVSASTLSNLLRNPSAEVNLTDWAGNSATISQGTNASDPAGEQYKKGGAFIRATSTVASGGWGVYNSSGNRPAVTPGRTYTLMAHILSITAGRACYIGCEWYTSGGGFVSSETGPVLSTLGMRRMKVVAPATAATCMIRVYVSTGAVGNVLEVDGLMVVDGDYDGEYFDGSMANYGWSGTAHLSTSIVTPLRQITPEGHLRVRTGRSDGATVLGTRTKAALTGTPVVGVKTVFGYASGRVDIASWASDNATTLRIYWYDAAGVVFGSATTIQSTSTATGEFVLKGRVAVPAGAAFAALALGNFAGNDGQAGLWDVTIYNHTLVLDPPYLQPDQEIGFTGDTFPEGENLRTEWTGTKYESPSLLYRMREEEVEVPGWARLLDPDLCPVKALPYLAQFVGETLPKGISEAAAREWIKDAPNSKRGTVTSIYYAAQRKLTGSRAVSVIERSDTNGVTNDDEMVVITYVDETPDPAGVLEDILSVSPADVKVNYKVLSGQTWDGVFTAFPSWGAIDTEYDTWADVSTDKISGTFSRPRP